MSTEDLPNAGPNDFGLPEGFFEQQFKSIAGKTTEIENWQLPGTKHIESCFPVPPGYWLAMEEGVRAQVKPSHFPSRPFAAPVLKWATIAASVTLVLSASVWLWFSDLGSNPENWQAKIQQIPREELLAYVGETQQEDRDWVELYAITSLGENGLPVTEKTETDQKVLEEALEETNPTDLLQELDIE